MKKLSYNEFRDARHNLSIWCATGLGESLIRAENREINKFLADLSGYRIIQIGNLAADDLLAYTKILHRINLLLTGNEKSENSLLIRCSHYHLPIASESTDVVVLPHLLEYSSEPHQVLREAERILTGEGHAIIVGFNPWSLWGIWGAVLRWRNTAPWPGEFISMVRIKVWLSLLDFEVVDTRYVFFRPPTQNQKIFHGTRILETLGGIFWPIFGGVYIILAKKRVVPLTPIKCVGTLSGV